MESTFLSPVYWSERAEQKSRDNGRAYVWIELGGSVNLMKYNSNMGMIGQA